MQYWYEYKIVCENGNTLDGCISASQTSMAIEKALKYERVLPELVIEIQVKRQEPVA